MFIHFQQIILTLFISTDRQKDYDLYFAGILIAGGWDSTSTEVFIPDTGKTCSLPDLPDSRDGHTLDTLGNTPVLCGGFMDSATSCLQLTPTSPDGVWTNYATTMESRSDHISWVSSAGLVLMGGYSGTGTTTEIVSSVPSGGSISLIQNTR